MTPRDLAFEALDMINASGSAATIASATARQLARIAHDITATLQEISMTAPSIYKTRRAQSAIAPETISITVTNGGVNCTATATFVNGSTIKIDGDNAWNEIRVESGQKKLLFPFGGTSGTVNATLYHDVLNLDSDAAELVDKPILEGFGYLDPSANKEDLLTYPRNSPDYRRRIAFSSPQTRLTGQPSRFFLENAYNSDHTTTDRIRVYPIPLTAYQLSYFIKVKARTVTASDLGSDGADSTFVLPIQGDYHESILKPLFLERWSGSAWFREDSVKKSIIEEAKKARALLTSYQPQRVRPRRLRAPL